MSEDEQQGQSPRLTGDLATAFEKLRAQYAKRLPTRIRDLCAKAERLRDEEADDLDSVRMLAHRLQGPAGSYGFAEVSEIAGTLEELFESDPGERHWDEINAGLARLRAREEVLDGD